MRQETEALRVRMSIVLNSIVRELGDEFTIPYLVQQPLIPVTTGLNPAELLPTPVQPPKRPVLINEKAPPLGLK